MQWWKHTSTKRPKRTLRAGNASRRFAAAWPAMLACALIVMSPSGTAAAEPVDLELVLAVDISGSIDPDEAQLQRNGYIAALTDPEVIRTIQHGTLGRIAVTYVEWAGADTALTVANWMIINDAPSAHRFADTIARAPLQTALWTSISNVIEYALPRFHDNGFEGTRRVIDISGDGPNNQEIGRAHV